MRERGRGALVGAWERSRSSEGGPADRSCYRDETGVRVEGGGEGEREGVKRVRACWGTGGRGKAAGVREEGRTGSEEERRAGGLKSEKEGEVGRGRIG